MFDCSEKTVSRTEESRVRDRLVHLLKAVIKKALGRYSIYPAIRDVYQQCFRAEWWAYRTEMQRFYANFISSGDLVFDIGANIGLYTEMFLRLGAHVVAVEPNPECASVLNSIRQNGRLVVEPAAVGSAPSEGRFFLCDDSDAHSTLSTEWMSIAQRTPRLMHKKWTRTITTGVITLDSLVAKYGRPEFIKIDVEGFECQALAGLLQAPRYLSFEFISEFADSAVECVRAKCFSSRACFNMITDPRSAGSRKGEFQFCLPEWVPADDMAGVLYSAPVRQAQTYGEIFVRDGLA